MDTPVAPSGEESRRAARIGWEAEKIAAAEREIAAGPGISGDALKEWLARSMETGEPVPTPLSSHHSDEG